MIKIKENRTLYTYDELEPSAQEKAHQNYIDSEMPWFWDEFTDNDVLLDAEHCAYHYGASLSGVKAHQFEMDTNPYSVKIDMGEINVEKRMFSRNQWRALIAAEEVRKDDVLASFGINKNGQVEFDYAPFYGDRHKRTEKAYNEAKEVAQGCLDDITGMVLESLKKYDDWFYSAERFQDYRMDFKPLYLDNGVEFCLEEDLSSYEQVA